MALMTSADFDRRIAKATDWSIVASLGRTAAISAALAAYHDSVRLNQAAAQQAAYLLQVVKACRDWRGQKASVAGHQGGERAGGATDEAEPRRHEHPR